MGTRTARQGAIPEIIHAKTTEETRTTTEILTTEKNVATETRGIPGIPAMIEIPGITGIPDTTEIPGIIETLETSAVLVMKEIPGTIEVLVTTETIPATKEAQDGLLKKDLPDLTKGRDLKNPTTKATGLIISSVASHTEDHSRKVHPDQVVRHRPNRFIRLRQYLPMSP
jgi:hypothetical protein